MLRPDANGNKIAVYLVSSLDLSFVMGSKCCTTLRPCNYEEIIEDGPPPK